MDGVSAQPHTRAPRRTGYNPQNELLGWMCIQAVAIGIAFAAVVEAAHNGDQGWGLLFSSLMFCVLYNYFWCAWTWANWYGE